MTYYSGSLLPLTAARRGDYRAHAGRAWPQFRRRGALRMVETWGEAIPRGRRTDFLRAVQATDDEAPVFSWIEWPDKAVCDAAWQSLMADPDVAAEMGEMPFDGRRMSWGGFEPVVTHGTDRGAGWIQGFMAPVPEANRSAYVAFSEATWQPVFAAHGALGLVEGWGVDVPHGTLTDLYRAVAAEDGERVVFGWTAWPDRAAADAANAAMTAAAGTSGAPPLPFDGKRMIWGGFSPLFDSAAEDAP